MNSNPSSKRRSRQKRLNPSDNEITQFGLFKQVFENDLLFGKISNYLTFGDKKVLRTCSQLLLHQVQNEKQFAEAGLLNIHQQSFDDVRKTTFPWKSVRFMLGSLQSKTEMVAVSEIVKHAENLMIVDVSEYFALSNKKWVSFMEMLISRSPSLKTLSLDSRLISKKLVNVLKKTKIRKTLGNLIDVQIFKQKGDAIPCVDFDAREDFYNVLQELHSNTKNLQAFHLGKIDVRNATTINEKITEIVDTNKQTLTSLTLSIQAWRIQKLRTVICPNLSNLNIVFKSRDSAIVKDFLRNHPSITNLSIQGLDNMPLSLMLTIQDIGKNWRKFHLKCPMFLDDVDDEFLQVATDWSFLSKFEKLEDIAIKRATDPVLTPHFDPSNSLEYVTVSNVLSSLPTKVQKIFLVGLEVEELEELNMMAVMTGLARFPHLMELSLLECTNVIDDEILQFICSRMSKLRVLEFSCCDTITSFGYTGIRQGENTGITLKNLKGLRRLRIENCTLDGQQDVLLKSIQFLELTTVWLKFDNSSRITQDLAEGLARNNPGLEYIHGDFETSEDIIEKNIKKFHPRFKKLLYEGLCGNSDAMSAYGIDDNGQPTGGWFFDHQFDDDSDYSFEYYDDNGDFFTDDDLSDDEDNFLHHQAFGVFGEDDGDFGDDDDFGDWHH